MPELVAMLLLSILCFRRPSKGQSCSWQVDGIGIDGSVFEVCTKCTRVRVYLVDRDGEPLSIYEFDKLDSSESTEDAVLREYKNNAGLIEIDNEDL